MADRPVVPPKKTHSPMKLQPDLDCSEHCHNPLDADHFYDCIEEIDSYQTQNYTTQPPAPANLLSAEQNMFNYAFTVSNFIHSAEVEENSDGRKTGNECRNKKSADDEEELTEVLKKLLQYGQEIRACARQCGLDADSFHCITPECTGTEPCLEPFVANSGNLEPTPRGDAEENDQEIPGEDVWCSASSSPRSVTNSETPMPLADTIRSLRLENLEQYFRENIEEHAKAQLSQSSNKQAHCCMKKSKSDSEVLGPTFQKSDEEGCPTESSSSSSNSSSSCSSSEIDKQHSSTEWSTLSCHTVVSTDSDGSGSSNSLTAAQDDDVYQDDVIEELEGRPDAGGDGGGSRISVHVTDDEGIYEFDVDDRVFVIPESGDQDVLDSTIAYNLNTTTQNRLNVPLRLTLTTEQMLDELFPAVRLQPRPVRILQSLADHPVPENTTGGGEGDFELGRRIVVQSFFVEDTSPTQEAADEASWLGPGFDVSRDSLHEIVRWTTIAGFCASVFLIWQLHYNSR